MNPNTELEIKIGLNDNEGSNLFLRKFFSVLRPFKSRFTATPAKNGNKQKIALGLLTISDHTIGVTCKYGKKGTIKSLIFNDIPAQLSDIIKYCVHEALNGYQNKLNQIKITYLFESTTHYIKPITAKNFEISLNKEDYSNTISFDGEGFDIEDIFTFNKFIFESMVDIISLFYNIPFDSRHQFSDRYFSLATPEELINTDPNFVKYKVLELDEGLIKILEKVVRIIKKELIDKEKKKTDEKDTCGDSNTGR